MKKRFCARLLVLCLAVGLLPAAALAAEDGGAFGTVRWTLDAAGGLTVSGAGDLPDRAFAGRTDIVAVTFTGQVARIGRSAFAGCTQLRRVDGFGAVTSVMSQAFAGCTALAELAVPGTVAEIGTGAFSGCTGLTAAVFAPGVRSLGAYALAGCTALRRVDLPDGMTLLGSGLFSGCAALAELPLPDDVAWVEPRLCENCTALQTVVLPAAMTEVPRGLLRGCTGLRRVTFQGAVTAVGDGAFSGCDALTDVYFTGTRPQWDAVAIGADNARLTAAALHTDAAAHTYPDAWTLVTEPTCTRDGLRTRTCTDPGCGKTLSERVPALGHDWDDGVIVRAPSGVRMGERRITCRRCGLTQAEAIPPEIAAYEQFHDLDRNAWSYDGIAYCVARGLMSGTDAHTFAPHAVTTRAQIVQILYNLAGEPAVTGETPFTDLTNAWYQDAVLWAYQTGVVAGTSATTFAPEKPVTREQIAVILMGYADMVQHLKHTWTPADLSAFPDGGQVSDWARDAMADAVALGLISGAQTKDGTLLLPQNSATREQVATILMEFYSGIDTALRVEDTSKSDPAACPANRSDPNRRSQMGTPVFCRFSIQMAEKALAEADEFRYTDSTHSKK